MGHTDSYPDIKQGHWYGAQVEEIALNMTVLKRWDGSRIWYPNSMINTVPILNITRSENKWEFFKVAFFTSLAVLLAHFLLCVSLGVKP